MDKGPFPWRNTFKKPPEEDAIVVSVLTVTATVSKQGGWDRHTRPMRPIRCMPAPKRVRHGTHECVKHILGKQGSGPASVFMTVGIRIRSIEPREAIRCDRWPHPFAARRSHRLSLISCRLTGELTTIVFRDAFFYVRRY